MCSALVFQLGMSFETKKWWPYDCGTGLFYSLPEQRYTKLSIYNTKNIIVFISAVLSSLTLLSRTTSILSDPGQVPQQAAEAVSKRSESEEQNTWALQMRSSSALSCH